MQWNNCQTSFTKINDIEIVQLFIILQICKATHFKITFWTKTCSSNVLNSYNADNLTYNFRLWTSCLFFSFNGNHKHSGINYRTTLTYKYPNSLDRSDVILPRWSHTHIHLQSTYTFLFRVILNFPLTC